MPEVPLPIANGFYLSDSLPISAQECVNYYPHIPDVPALNQEVLLGAPGIRQAASTGASVTDATRGNLEMNGKAFFVNGQSLFRLNSDHTTDNLGTILGTGPVSMADNGTQVCILIPGSTGYIFTESPDTLVTITDADFTANGNPLYVAFVDGYFVFTTDADKFIISALNDGTSYNALDFGTAESSPDAVVAPFVHKNQLYVGGDTTTEAFTNTGGNDFPFQRTGLFLDVGVVAPFSLTKLGGQFAFIGSGEGEGPAVFQLAGNDVAKISTQAIDRILQDLTAAQLAAVTSWAYGQAGHYFIGFVLPTRAIVYDFTTGRWHERKSRVELPDGTFSTVTYRVCGVVPAYGELYVGDSRDGRIGILDLDTYTEYGEQVSRVFATQPFQNNMKPFSVPMLELTVESGVGVTPDYTTLRYSATSYLEELVAVADTGTVSGGVWVFNETSSSDPATDESKWGNHLDDFGSPLGDEPSFIDDNLNATSINSSTGYDYSSMDIRDSGSFGFIYEHGGANSVSMAIVEWDGLPQQRLLAQYISDTTIRVVVQGSGFTAINLDWTGSFSGDHVYYITYSCPWGSDTYSIELFVDFVSLGVMSGSTGGSNWTNGGPEIRFGAGNGNGEGIIQYGFYNDFILSASQITGLQAAYEQNFSTYVDQSPVQTTPESSVTPMVRLQVSRDGGKTFSPERARPMGAAGEYNRRAIWRRNGRTARFDVYRFIMSAPVKPVVIQLTGQIDAAA